MSEPFLVYFADPMCSWCYGFGPELDALAAGRPHLRVDVVMGGLRPYHAEKSTAEFRATIAEHWAHVARESGLPFNTRRSRARTSCTTPSPHAARWSPCARPTPPARCPTSSGCSAPSTPRSATSRGPRFSRTSPRRRASTARSSSPPTPRRKPGTRSGRTFPPRSRPASRGFPLSRRAIPGAAISLVTAGFARAAEIADRLDRIHAIAGLA